MIVFHGTEQGMFSPQHHEGPTRHVSILVFLQMSVEIGLLTKTSVTQVALKWLLLVVDVADVPLQVGGDAEGAITVFASGK